MNTPKVLIVEDETDIAEALSFALENSGYRTETVFDGLTGLATAQTDPPDLMLLDVMLPGCNGYEVSRQLKDWMEASPDAVPFPILLITARKVSTPEREEFVATWSRADGVLYKPFDLDDLIEKIEDTLLVG